MLQCPNFNSLRVVSFSAAVMSLSYSTIAIGGAIAIGKQPDAYYNLDRFSTADKVSNPSTMLDVVRVKTSGCRLGVLCGACRVAPEQYEGHACC